MRPTANLPRRALVVACVVLAVPAAAPAERLLGLAQLPGGQACIAQLGDDSEASLRCSKAGRGLIDANGITVSQDGRSVYVAAVGASAVSSFARDAGSGRIVEVNCISANGTSGI